MLNDFSRPHDVLPSLESARVVLAIKNFAAIPGVCHIGLGVTALNTMKVLRRHGMHIEAWSIPGHKEKGKEFRELRDKLTKSQEMDSRPVTHVLVSAPSWIQPNEFYELALIFQNVTFVQLNHSGCAYLSIDKYGIRNIREIASYSESTHNIKVAANNERVAKFIDTSFGVKSLYLPNLYDTESFVDVSVPHRQCGTLRIGSFGASRPWKNQLCAAEAAVMIGRKMGCLVELFVNSKRPDGGERMIEARDELFNMLPHAKIVNVPWLPWPAFRDLTSTMHLLIQPSFDETFNVCTADGIAEGVPSVTTSALEWTPRSWWAHAEDPNNIAEVGIGLMNNATMAIRDGRHTLRRYVEHGTRRWLDFVQGQPPLMI